MGADDRCCFSEFDTQEPARQECRWASHLVLSQLLSSSSAASGARMEWYADAPLAKKAGNSDSIIADLKANRRPGGMSPEEEVVYDFITELSSKHAVSDELFERAKKRLRAAGRRSDGSRGNLRRRRDDACDVRRKRARRQDAAVHGRRTVAPCSRWLLRTPPAARRMVDRGLTVHVWRLHCGVRLMRCSPPLAQPFNHSSSCGEITT
jgi:hypothetical protein